jgi:hypothetical protein
VWVDCTVCNFAKQYQVSGCTEDRNTVCKDLAECDPRLVMGIELHLHFMH